MGDLSGPFSGTKDLEKEMKKICTAVQASGYAERQAVVKRIRSIICGANRSLCVELYGSSSTGLFVEESDVDLVILVPAKQLQEGDVAFLTRIYNQLMAGQRTWRLENVRINTYTAIPFVKAVDTQSGLEVGITCAELTTRTSVLLNSQWIRSVTDQHPSVKILVVSLKTLLRDHDLPNIGAGGISSYALTLMVISYVQHANRRFNLGDLLLGFLKLYGDNFDYENKAIVLTNGGRIGDKRQLRGMTDPVYHQLIIQDPVDPTKNAAKQSLGGLGRVREVFRKAYEAMKPPVNDDFSEEVAGGFLAAIGMVVLFVLAVVKR